MVNPPSETASRTDGNYIANTENSAGDKQHGTGKDNANSSNGVNSDANNGMKQGGRQASATPHNVHRSG